MVKFAEFCNFKEFQQKSTLLKIEGQAFEA